MMKAFHTIAVPHQDILEGRLTMDVFAADLWETSQGRGPDEYRDGDAFFRKTYLTQGLQNILDIVEKRLSGRGGDPVIQIQTPFGGGKTHSLIALYHRAQAWGAKPVVVAGTALHSQTTLWGLIEEQLTGKVTSLSGQTAPGKEALRKLLAAHQPLLILMDEVLEYITKAAGVKVVESTLAAQTIAFLQELTETASALERVCVIVTLPSSIVEHYDETAEKFYQKLQKVTGRIEKIYTPVQDDEITQIIRRRLFSQVKEKETKAVVSAYLDYAEQEGILPAGVQPSEYRSRFFDSYPFLPEVVDILYHQWGSFPTFQRTRGVLRLLSLVIHALKGSDRPFISLADFDLARQDLRQEFVKHIGVEFNGVIAADITDPAAGTKKVDASLGSAYQGLHLGTRAAQTIFLYSFSGGLVKGATSTDIKRAATTTENPASVVAEAVEQLKGKLGFLQSEGDRCFFSNQPNLNRIRLVKMENIVEDRVTEVEKDLLREAVRGGKVKVFVWEEQSGNIPDGEELKLVILKRENGSVREEILKNKGQTPRVYRNTLFFLYPVETERIPFSQAVKYKLACEAIEGDKTLNLSQEQRKENRKELGRAEENLTEAVRRLYRMMAIPVKDGFKEPDMGIPTFGEAKKLIDEVYEKLRSDGEIVEKIAPLVLKEKYLAGTGFVHTEKLYQACLRTPGETRPVSRSVMEQGITEGVVVGLFGLGELESDQPVCRYFKERPPSMAFAGDEIIVAEAICKEQRRPQLQALTGDDNYGKAGKDETGREPEKTEEKKPPAILPKGMETVHLKFRIPKGKVAGIMGVMNLLQSKFENLEIELTARDGAMSEQDYEDKIEETFRQLGINVSGD